MNMTSEDEGPNHGETRPGWCSLCQVDCRTEAVLLSHSMGKRHKKQIQKQNTGHEGLMEVDCPHSREEPEYSAAFEQVWQDISMSKGPTLAGSTDGKESAEVLQKELDNATTLGENGFKEQLNCELCSMSFQGRKCLDDHLAGKIHEARHITFLSEVEIAHAGAAAETDLDMSTSSGKKRCRDEFEGEMGLQCSLAASNAAGQGEEKGNQVLRFDQSNVNGNDEGTKENHLVPSSLTSHVANVPVIGQEAVIQHRKEIRCELCNIECDSKISLQAHVAGKKHALRLKRSLATDAMPCLNVSEAKYLDIENGGNKKKKKRSRVEMESKKGPDCNNTASDGQDGGFGGGNTRIEEDRQMSCDICNIRCSARKELEWHYLGKKHAAHLKKLLASNVPASVGITGMPTDCCKKVLEMKGNQVLKEESLNGAAQNCPDVKRLVKHFSVGTVSGGPGDAVLVGDNKTIVRDETECDLCNILCGNKYALEDCSIGREKIACLKTLLTKGGSASVTKAGSVNGDGIACAGAETHPVLETLTGEEIKTEKEQIVSALCGTDCVMNTESNVIFKMHATCLLKLLTMDEKACVGAVEAMLREVQIVRERDAISQSKFSCSAQLLSLWEGEGIQTEQQECKVCHVKCGSRKDLNGHLAGKKHLIQLKKLRGRCELCNVYCGGKKALKSHMAGKKHAAKLRLLIGERGCIDMNGTSFPVRHENNDNSEDELKVTAESTQPEETGETLLIDRQQGDGNAADVLKIFEHSKQTVQTGETVLMERHQGYGNPEDVLKISEEGAQVGQTGQTVLTDTDHHDQNPEYMSRITEEAKQTGQSSQNVPVVRDRGDNKLDDVLKISENSSQTRQAGESFVINTHNGNVSVLKISEESTQTEQTGHPVFMDSHQGNENPEVVLKIPEESNQTGQPSETVTTQHAILASAQEERET